MNARAAEIYVAAANKDAGVARAVAVALGAAGMSSFAATDAAPAQTAAALEAARAVVVVLSAAANTSLEVSRALERAAGRGLPIVSYAIDATPSSPSIAYFTGTTEPIRAVKPEATDLAPLIEATRRAITPWAPTRPSAQQDRSRYSKATYVDARRMHRVFVGILTLVAAFNVYALVHDVVFLVNRAAGRGNTAQITADVYLAVTALAAPLELWVVLLGSIVIFRRIRLNLLAMLVTTVRTGSAEIVWRPLVPVANVFWLARMATDLWNAAAPAGTQPQSWRAARQWGTALFAAFSVGVVRDMLTRYTPERVATIVGISVPIDVLQLIAAVLTYRVFAELDSRVRAKHDIDPRIRVDQPRLASAPATEANQQAGAGPSPTPRDALVLFAKDDEAVAVRVGAVLQRDGVRCWTVSEDRTSMAVESFSAPCFSGVVVIVSTASQDSEAIAALVQRSVAARVPVIPFVVDAPAPSTALGYYIRSLHWVERIADLTAIRLDAPSAAVPPRDVFAPLRGSGQDAAYRRAPAIRITAQLFAITQALVAGFVALATLGIALAPGATEPSATVGVSIVLLFASLPAWASFLLWLGFTHRNCRAVHVRDLDSRLWLLSRVGVPGLGVLAGGRGLRRLCESLGSVSPSSARKTVAGVGWIWTVAGVTSVAMAMGSWYLAGHGALRAGMVLAAGESVAVLTRGFLRARVVGVVGRRLDALAGRTASVVPSAALV